MSMNCGNTEPIINLGWKNVMKKIRTRNKKGGGKGLRQFDSMAILNKGKYIKIVDLTTGKTIKTILRSKYDKP